MNPERISEFLFNHWIIASALVLVSALLIQDTWESITRKFKRVSTAGAVDLINNHDPAILDVREPFEHAKGHIQDAINIPAAKLSKRMNEIEKYKTKPLLVVCQTGTRSVTACKNLYKQGYENVIHLTGGIQAWEDHKLPLMRKKSHKKSAKAKSAKSTNES
ncbi:MAG TPA: rhodanese-like domain-containing protein [Crenotrichaceae bacterium]|nr:rhodanese-like domain-containing protein [Crenotrichaceae bacterium]